MPAPIAPIGSSSIATVPSVLINSQCFSLPFQRLTSCLVAFLSYCFLINFPHLSPYSQQRAHGGHNCSYGISASSIKDDLGDGARLLTDTFTLNATDSVGDSVSVVRDNSQTAAGKKEHHLANDDVTNSDASHVYFVSNTIIDGALADPAAMCDLIRSLHIDPAHSKIIVMSSRGIDHDLRSPSFLQSILSGGSSRPEAFYAALKHPDYPSFWGYPGAPAIVYLVASPGISNALEQLAKESGLLYEKRGHILRVYQPLDEPALIHIRIFSILSMVRDSMPDIRHNYEFPTGYFERQRAERSRWLREEMVLPWLGRLVRVIGLLYLLLVPTGVLGTVSFGFAITAVVLPPYRGRQQGEYGGLPRACRV